VGKTETSLGHDVSLHLARAATDGERTRENTRSATMFRCTSPVPPPMVSERANMYPSNQPG